MTKRDSDDLIKEIWQKLLLPPDPEVERLEKENDAAVEAQKAREAAAWRDTTNDRPLFGR